LKNLQIQVIVKSFEESIYFSSLHDSEEKPQLNFQRILWLLQFKWLFKWVAHNL